MSPPPPRGASRLTLIAQGHARRCPTAVRAELHEEVSAGAEQPLDGQVLHLVGVIHWRGLHVVSVADDEPGPGKQQRCGWSHCPGWGAAPGLGSICSWGTSRPGPPVPPGLPSPVVILRQGNLLEVQVQPLAFRGLKQPVAGEIVAVVAREARGDEAARGGVAGHSTAGGCETGPGLWAGFWTLDPLDAGRPTKPARPPQLLCPLRLHGPGGQSLAPGTLQPQTAQFPEP